MAALVGIYRRKEKLVKVSAYVPESVERQIDLLSLAWSRLDRVTDPQSVDWSKSETVGRLVVAALGGALSELGLSPESTEADVERVTAEVARRAPKAK